MAKKLPVNAGDIRDVGSIPGLGRFPGGGHGHPFQYSCLENPMDRRAWCATVHGVPKSWTYDWVIFTLFGTSLVFQWLRCYTSKAGGMVSIPGLETKIPHAPQYGQKIFLKKYFPAGPVSKTLHSQCMGPGFDPWSGNQIPDLIPDATTKTECSQINKYWTFVVTQMVKNLPTVRETRVQSLDWEGLLEENGNPLQDSCLEYPMDIRAWGATVQGVAKSQTRLSD